MPIARKPLALAGLALAAAMASVAGASPALAQAFNLADRPLAATQRQVLAPADLGGGFIEFLFSGGQSGDATVPAPRTRRMPYQTAAMPAYASPGLAYATTPAATRIQPERPRMAPQFEPSLVDYQGTHRPGTIVIDTTQRFLYLVMDGGKAMRYGVGVGRPGFEWSGTRTITRKAEWPEWRPPAEMRKRRPDLPVYMAGGPSNPLGARAMYLGGSLYRIHGSNEPQTIGQAVSSGCIRMRNEDVIDLYERVGVGTPVVVI
jgi:lipoprotein-anchoring transpeptidase ErfK/SrfK